MAPKQGKSKSKKPAPETPPSQLAAYVDLFERMRDPIFLLDPDDFHILDANDACEDLIGESVEKLLGQDFLGFVAEDNKDAFYKGLRVARRYYPRHFQARWIVKGEDGKEEERFIDVAACMLKLSDENEVIQLMGRDISEEVAAKEKEKQYLEKLEELNSKLKAISVTDEMTQISNFRHFQEALAQEHERCERYGSTYSIIFCDVDHFKHYNDTNGHPAGDEVLRGVARILKEKVRNTDLPARYGGEEFVVLCRGVPEDGASILADRIRGWVEEHSFEHGENQPLGALTISVGVASFPSDGKSSEDVMHAADNALYASKFNGRNRVTLAKEVKNQNHVTGSKKAS